MAIAVLSPCVLRDYDNNEMLHCEKISNLLNNLHKYSTLKLQYYQRSPYWSYSMLIPYYEGQAMLNNYIATHIYSCIQKMLDGEYVELDGVEPAVLPEGFCIENTEIDVAFCSYLNYIKEEDAVIFIGEKNFGYSNGLTIKVNEMDFCMSVSTYVLIEKTDMLKSYLKEPEDVDVVFPREEFCAAYNDYVLEEAERRCMNESCQQALFMEVGEVVAIYNFYEKNNTLSNKNTTASAKRIVFEKVRGKKYYLSLDLESGGFEVFDKNYHHLGQYNFSGKQVKKAEPRNHRLRH